MASGTGKSAANGDPVGVGYPGGDREDRITGGFHYGTSDFRTFQEKKTEKSSEKLRRRFGVQGRALPRNMVRKLCNIRGKFLAFSELTLKSEHIYYLEKLVRKEGASRHKDPFDRILLAQAMSEEMIFMTHDSKFLDYVNAPIIFKISSVVIFGDSEDHK